jgi:hypothetical protein
LRPGCTVHTSLYASRVAVKHGALLLCISRPVAIAPGSVFVDQRAERFA